MAKPGKIQTWLEYALARSIFGALGALPVRGAIEVGERMGSIAYFLTPHLKRTAERNLTLAFPEKSEAERRQMIRNCFRSLGRLMGLMSKFSTASREDLLDIIDFQGLEHWEKTEASGRPILYFTAHIGAWELTNFSHSLLGKPFDFLARRADNPKVEQLLELRRTKFGNRSIDKRGAARTMLKQFHAKGRPIGLLVDLNTLDEEAVFVDFFGVPAATNFVIAKIALRTNAVIQPMFCPWDDELGKFRGEFVPAITFTPTGDEQTDVLLCTQAITKTVEDYVRRYPDQWLWVHKRWKTRPKGEPPIYA